MIQIENYKNFYQNYSFLKIKDETEREETANKVLYDVMIFVMDKSGSMSGSRINNLKAAVIDLTEKVKTSFKSFHYITFNSTAEEINFEQINDLRADGGTSFDAANAKMFQCIDNYANGTNFTIIYFTDGEGSVDFNSLRTKLNGLKDKDVVFNTIGFSSESNKRLLIELTQAGSSFGTYKSIDSSADIKFDEFAHFFNQRSRGYLEFANEKVYFSLDLSNEAVLFINEDKVKSALTKCFLNNEEEKFNSVEKSFKDVVDAEDKLRIFEAFFNFELLKNTNENRPKEEILKMFKEYRTFIEMQTVNEISANSSIFEVEFINEKYSDLKQTLDAYIAESQKSNANFIELKSLTYSNISKRKFQKKMDERAAKNEIKFMTNLNKIKELIKNEQETIEKLDINDFNDVCYLTQLSYKDLLKNMDCLGICAEITRNSEVVIVDPNFIKVNEIGYSSFVSLNSMFMALKYYIDKSQDEQEIVKLHGGFMKNFKSHFLEGTHRANYNAMIPLFVNEFHWKIARRLLEPLFGYLVTLNIEGYAASQYYTLYFLMFEKVIADLLEKPNSEAIKRIYDQMKLCCENVLKEFYILKPNVQEFITERTKRTKDEWPNLNSYLLYIYLTEDERKVALDRFDEFEYASFEEQLRRFLGTDFEKTYNPELFTINKSSIFTAAEQLFNMYMDNDEESSKIVSSTPEELVKIINEKTNIQLDNFEEALNGKVADKLKEYFNKFRNNRFTRLFNYVFNTETNFFKKFESVSVPMVYQILTNGFENANWRLYRNYQSFMNDDGKKYLNEIYLDQVFKAFSSEYGKLVGNMKEKRAELLSNKYLSDENYTKYNFVVGEGIYFKMMLKSLQKHGDIERIEHFINNATTSKAFSEHWKPSKKNLCKFFKIIYKNERRNRILNNTDDATISRSDLDILKNIYPNSWTFLSTYTNRPSYLFSRYRFEIDRSEFEEKGREINEYLSTEDLNDYYLKPNTAAVPQPVNNQPAVPVIKPRIVNVYEDYSQKSSNKPIIELEKVWINEQFQLKNQIILKDNEDWQTDLTKLKYIGVADLIADKNDNSTCAAGLLIFEIDHAQQKFELIEGHLLKTKLVEPYVSGLLAFREAYAYQYLLNKCTIKPQCLIFDGNGVLHKREFGLASHVGVLENIVTIGFSKTLHFVDSFPYKTLPEFRNYYKNLLKTFQDHCELKTIDNKVLGYAYLSGVNSMDPVFISQGHKISSPTAINVMKLVDSYLKNMNRSARESLVGFVDKLTRRCINGDATFSTNLDDYF